MKIKITSLRACLKSRSRRQKAHFFNCQTGRFPEQLEPRHLGAYHGMRVFRQALRHGIRKTTVFLSARGRAQRRRRFGPARRGKPTHSQSASQSVPLQAVRNLGILNEDISAP